MSDRYLPSGDQVALARSIGESLKAILPLARLQESTEESAQTWSALRDLGVLAIATPVGLGGSGLGAAEESLIAIELGRRVVAPSVLATMGAAHLRPDGVRSAPEGEGRVAAGYCRGDRVVFVDDVAANRLLLRDESGARLFAAPRSSRLIDDRLWSLRLREAVGLDEPLATADPGQALRLRLLDAAALAGLAQSALEMAVEYAGVREQFGRPIGSFQAVKHQCADMALAARSACDQVAFAAVAVDDGRDDAALQVESAFFVAGSASIDNCARNIQVHGGIGFSDEAAPHRLLKRARVFVQIAGGLEAALRRVGGCPAAFGTRSRIGNRASGGERR